MRVRISKLLIVAILFSMLSGTSAAGSAQAAPISKMSVMDNYEKVYLNVPKEVFIPAKKSANLQFTPEKDGIYSIECISDKKTGGTVKDSAFSIVELDFKYLGTGNNYRIVCKLSANQTYCIESKGWCT